MTTDAVHISLPMAPQELLGGTEDDDELLHFLVVPLMSQSHLIPFIDMAKQIASCGPIVTVLLTPLNALRFCPEGAATQTTLKLRFLVLPFPCKEAGLPEGCENMDSLPSPDLISNFFDANNMLRAPLEAWLDGVQPRPNCLVSDICLPWTADIGLRFDIPRVVFHTVSCFTMLCTHNLDKSGIKDSVKSDSEPFQVPDIPDNIVFTKSQLPKLILKDKGLDDAKELLNEFKAAELSADGVLVNTFEELEPYYVKDYRNIVNRLWCIGPVSLFNMTSSSKVDRGNKSTINERHCLEWLDLRSPGTVLYVCFGSMSHVPVSQLVEVALGLEASNCPFVWVIKKGDHWTKLEKWLEEEKFEDRVKEKGMIIRGWAPQVLILSHRAVGGFMTHCGWNSTLEGVSVGVPMITWPMFAEQFYNEKLVVHVLGTGVRVGVERSVTWGEEEEAGVLVTSEDVRMAVERLMDGGEEGEERRRRAAKFGDLAKKAVQEGGSSFSNINLMIRKLEDLRRKDSN